MWEWFVGTKAGRFIVGLAAVIAAFIAAYLAGLFKGKHTQAEEDAAKQAEEQAAFGRLAQQVQTDAGAAAAKVRDAAAKQPAPDTSKRDDLDSTF